MLPGPERVSCYLGENLVLTTTVQGRKIYVDGRDTTVAPHLIADGYWESWVSRVFERILCNRNDEQGAAVLDIGANFGWYALLARWIPEPEHYSVWAFEPNPLAIRCLQRTWSVNGMQMDQLRQMALGDHEGEVWLSYYRHELANCRLLGVGDSGTEPVGAVVSGERLADNPPVPLSTLDRESPEGTRVGLIKIDAEGSEPAILRGAKRVLAENPSVEILLEHHPDADHEELYRELLAQDFRLFWVNTDAELVPRSVPECRELEGGQMLYTTRPTRPERS
jgi:FkbM family methyltransferase